MLAACRAPSLSGASRIRGDTLLWRLCHSRSPGHDRPHGCGHSQKDDLPFDRRELLMCFFHCSDRPPNPRLSLHCFHLARIPDRYSQISSLRVQCLLERCNRTPKDKEMLKSWSIKNFKPIVDSGELQLAPVTVLAGPNSSGKSSLLQCIFMIVQTL